MNTSSQLTNSQLNYSENTNGETTEKSTPNIEYTLNDYYTIAKTQDISELNLSVWIPIVLK